MKGILRNLLASLLAIGFFGGLAVLVWLNQPCVPSHCVTGTIEWYEVEDSLPYTKPVAHFKLQEYDQAFEEVLRYEEQRQIHANIQKGTRVRMELCNTDITNPERFHLAPRGILAIVE